MELVRSRRRSLELRVFPDGRVQVRAPLRAPQRDIHDFVESRQDWLASTLDKMSSRPAPPTLDYRDGEQHLLLGSRIPLQVTLSPRKSVALTANGIAIQSPETEGQAVAQLLERFYRAQAKSLFEELVDRHFPYFAARGHVRPRLAIKKMRTRWGSLSTRGSMSLNLELVKVPLALCEYVVVHELCHLEHGNHGAGFKALMSERMPDWKARKQALEQAPLL